MQHDVMDPLFHCEAVGESAGLDLNERKLLPFTDLDCSQWWLVDQMKEVVYEREGSDLKAQGLYLDTSPWETSVFAPTKRT